MREDPFKVCSGFDVITAKTTEITDNQTFDTSAFDVRHQPVELWPVKNRTCPAIVDVSIDEIQIGAICNIRLAYLNLICNDIHGLALSAVLNRETCIDSGWEHLRRGNRLDELSLFNATSFLLFRAICSSLLLHGNSEFIGIAKNIFKGLLVFVSIFEDDFNGMVFIDQHPVHESHQDAAVQLIYVFILLEERDPVPFSGSGGNDLFHLFFDTQECFLFLFNDFGIAVSEVKILGLVDDSI